MRKDKFEEEERHGGWLRRRFGKHFPSSGVESWKEARGRFAGEHIGHRIFDHGELRFVILKLIGEKPSYGYELMKRVEELLGGAYSPSPGIVYPTLAMLEEVGLATVETQADGKKLYSVTAQGREFLKANRAMTNAIFARMEHAAATHGRGRAPQVLRAVQNLQFTLKLKTSHESLSDEQIRTIARIIDDAARKIEQC